MCAVRIRQSVKRINDRGDGSVLAGGDSGLGSIHNRLDAGGVYRQAKVFNFCLKPIQSFSDYRGQLRRACVSCCRTVSRLGLEGDLASLW